MIPGEYRLREEEIELNAGKLKRALTVINIGDRPIQVGSHYHFFETNRALQFPREEAYGMRLDIAAGTAVRFEPGVEREVVLTELGGHRMAFGLNGLAAGPIQAGELPAEVRARWKAWEEEG